MKSILFLTLIFISFSSSSFAFDLLNKDNSYRKTSVLNLGKIDLQTLCSIAQDSGQVTATKNRFRRRTDFNNSLTFQTTALAVKSINLSYTRYFNDYVGVGLELGYKPAGANRSYQNSNSLNINGPTDQIMFMSFSESKYIGLYTKVYVENKTALNLFCSLTAFYRNTRYNNGSVNWEDQVGGLKGAVREYNDSLNVDQNQKGLKVLAGINPVIAVGKKMALELEAYIGFSVRNISTSLYHYRYSYTGNEYDIPPNSTTVLMTNQQEDKTREYVVNPQAGIKIGIRF